ncbi:T9SS type A sorting domain-containing protein [Pedobacter sp. BS3]|uniref:T9SS type A sorting domain-containing protein n=1 Tax=Pedobacter sp. BS3 TaxID=2567937 RepID=UPI0011EBB8F2|nr:T9SS type A sorting domain-containing protein [Pedobacter sp. BS3]TZF82063.1 T9SS type A sorting domain-containing protein [Pedobacter sp. BS3]
MKRMLLDVGAFEAKVYLHKQLLTYMCIGKKMLCFLFYCCGLLMCMLSAYAQDAFMGYNYETDTYPLAWATTATTFNSGTTKEVIFLNNGDAAKQAQICSPSNNKISHYELGGTGKYIEIDLTNNSVGGTLEIEFTGSSNSTTANAAKGGVVYSDKLPFDLNSVIGGEETDFFPATNGNWTKLHLTPPSGTKSLRMYRRIYYWAANNKADEASGSSTGRVQLGLGQTLRVASMAAWITPPPDDGDPLPIKLLSFTGSAQAQGVRLAWSTASEVNTDRFEIERREENSAFVKISEVKAAGNSSKTLNYMATDNGVTANGTYYYRLKMVDADGSVEYSNAVPVKYNLSAAAQLTVYPNPASGKLTVSHAAATAGSVLKVISLKGATVLKAAVESGTSESALDITALNPGMYLVRFENNGEKSSVKFYKK